MKKPTKHAISVIIQNQKGETLFARRSPHKKSFPLAWSLPSHFVNDDESPEDTIARIGLHKLGVKLTSIRLLNEGYGDRPDFQLFMHDYAAVIESGEPKITSDDYTELTWAKADEFLPTIQVKGECTRLYSEYLEKNRVIPGTDPDNKLPLWTIDNSQYIVNDRFLKLRRDSCTTPQGGKVDTYYVLELADWVNCIIIDDDDNVILLQQYRHGVQKYIMEFIGGSMEKTDDSPESAARREVLEETGYTGGTYYRVGTSYPNPANHTNRVHTFLAVGGKIDQDQNLEVGETIRVTKIPFKTVIKKMSQPDAVYPAIYIAALFHVMNFIKTSDQPALQHLKQYV